MNRTTKFLASAFAAWSILAFLTETRVTAAPEGRVILVGLVLDASSGAPLSGAVVTAQSAATSAMAHSAEDGSFRLVVAPGAYTITASHEGYEQSQPTQIVLSLTRQTSLTLRLMKTLKTLGSVRVLGRAANLVGKAQAASAGTIAPEQIATRPILRPGELLEQIPGLVITQHSGEGKANQYYLRGFQLDHGTDLEATVMGVPINLPTHAHGQGYSDINWLLPELVSFVEFRKGPYYADQGDFSTAGAYDLYYKNTVDPIASLGIGTYGYERLFVAASPVLGVGHLLYGLEIYHDNGSLVKPDHYHKLNAVLRWSRESPDTAFNVTLTGYGGDFDSSDQIPHRLVAAGILSPYGYEDPSDGGQTTRTALSTEWQRRDAAGVTRFNAYGFSYYLNLFSNFTYFYDDANDYYNVTANPVTCNPLYTTCNPGAVHVATYVSYCPANVTPTNGSTTAHSVTPAPFVFACGDQREQEDRRFVSGFNLSRSFATPATETTVGLGLRNDNISEVGLFLTKDRQRFPQGTLSDDHVVERDNSLWVQTVLHVGPRLRLVPGLRADVDNFVVHAVDPRNSGRLTAGIMGPKFTAAYEMSPHEELYANYGQSFHSNDARGILQVDDPQTHAPVDPTGAPVQSNVPLVRGTGEEIGYRYSVSYLTTTVALWQLNLNSELVFDGDHGTTSPAGPTERQGFEITNYYTPHEGIYYDLDLADSNARFLVNPGGLGTYVPESLHAVISAGATFDEPAHAASLRVRYFGPRVLDQAGDAFSRPSTLLNGQYTFKFRNGNRISLDVFNILNTLADDVEYYYGSWLPQDALNAAYAKDPKINPLLGGGGVNDYHFHPAEKRTVRLTFATRL
jgi:hypothetical protein